MSAVVAAIRIDPKAPTEIQVGRVRPDDDPRARPPEDTSGVSSGPTVIVLLNNVATTMSPEAVVVMALTYSAPADAYVS